MEIIKAINDNTSMNIDNFSSIKEDLEKGYTVYITVRTYEEDKVLNKEINKVYKKFNNYIGHATVRCNALATYRINTERKEVGYDDLEFYYHHIDTNRFGSSHSFYCYEDNKFVSYHRYIEGKKIY